MIINILIIVLQIIFALYVIIFEKNNKKIMFFWLFLVILIPILGYFIYIVFGNALKFSAEKIIKKKYKTAQYYLQKTPWYKSYQKEKKNQINSGIFTYFSNALNTGEWHYKDIKLFYCGYDFVAELTKDILCAKTSINIEFYIFADDKIGNYVKDLLIKKAQDGVEIKIVYDAFGSHKTKKTFWEHMEKYGIKTASFFPAVLKFFPSKINYRNHRKIIVIDGHIAYTGGVNLRDDHMGECKKTSPWRDTMLKICGGAVYALQDIFVCDYCFAKNQPPQAIDTSKLFPNINGMGRSTCNVISSDVAINKQRIKKCYEKMIDRSKNQIIIQTPYFVIDGKLKQKIINAQKRGVKISLIIPKKPDEKIVYAVTLKMIESLIKNGVKVYLFNGFIHSKIFIADNTASVGTCNFDNRSLKLNFENTIIFSDKAVVNQIKKTGQFGHQKQLQAHQQKT